MAIEVGAEAPDFVLKNQNNQLIRLADYRGRRTVLLIFYPLAFSGICSGELQELQNNLAAYDSDAVEVLTVSVDSVYSHKVWADRDGYTFTMLADFWPHGGVARAYGVFNDTAGFANRGTFVIDKAGVIRFAEEFGPGEARDQEAWREALAKVAKE